MYLETTLQISKFLKTMLFLIVRHINFDIECFIFSYILAHKPLFLVQRDSLLYSERFSLQLMNNLSEHKICCWAQIPGKETQQLKDPMTDRTCDASHLQGQLCVAQQLRLIRRKCILHSAFICLSLSIRIAAL